MVNKMLDYGAYAQKYFKYDTKNLAAANPSDVSNVVIPDTYNTTLTENVTDKIEYYGFSLVLESETTIRLYFNIVDDTIDIDKLTSDQRPIVKKTDNLYYVEIPDIPAGELDKEQDVTVRYDGESQFEVKTSAFSYAQKAISSETASNDLKDLMKAMYQYGTAAKIYFATVQN